MGHQLSDAWVMTREASERAEPTDVQATFNHAMPFSEAQTWTSPGPVAT
jgi:hypothetical protein